jgi:hypothetical protein
MQEIIEVKHESLDQAMPSMKQTKSWSKLVKKCFVLVDNNWADVINQMKSTMGWN